MTFKSSNLSPSTCKTRQPPCFHSENPATFLEGMDAMIPSGATFAATALILVFSALFVVKIVSAGFSRDVVFVKFFQRPVVILNSVQAARDLLGKRGAKYSGRPRHTYINELLSHSVGWTGNSSFRTNDEIWKRHRKWYQHAVITRVALDSYRLLQRREADRTLYDILQDPENYRHHLKRIYRYVAGVALEIAYGRSIKNTEDKFIRLIEKGAGEALEGGGRASALVDFFPILRFLPSWVPGAEFQRSAARARLAVRALENEPYTKAAGTAKQSFTRSLIEDCLAKGALTKEDEDRIKGVAGTIYVGASETTLTVLLTFVLEMVLHPGVLQRVQDELDSVVGDSRLPDFEDRSSLPYFEICPAGPIGLPHYTTEEDVYRGYYIPKDTIVIANIWAMTRDPQYYDDPEEFRPERYLDDSNNTCKPAELQDPQELVFGFGRRICPGQHLADRNIWIVLARMAATMDIRKSRDRDGKEVTPNPKIVGGTVSYADVI
ncbi:cytochrome P450 monooxygenase [Rhodofomes roseus]|uniref:Cytochrome P450 monooxygenase n=1 Tax=Rhodofomes roseus TaxID=34475 RepID=A0ABQ8KBJ9_9APHY|nr:cytochrome P450 monooxygenase [Rhodofomes roseus]KAH9834644.1 cytochrome P450 monooxygenase [Rhodofomes roseus]